MKLESVQKTEAELLLPTYNRNPLLLERGEGAYLIDEDGERYLDLLSGLGVNALGYGHAAIEEAIVKQSKRLIHTSNLFYGEGQSAVAERLTRQTGLDRAFFCNSGTEAIEGALKLARAHAGLLREEGKTIGTKVLALEHSFHGRTYGAVSATHKAKYREPFEPVVPGFEFVALNDVEDLRAKFSNEVCAILVEAIQGEGGIHLLSQEFFDEARRLTLETGALLIVDEIQAGMGRTGKWCAYQHYGIQPDIVTFAKPLAGGLPMGALVCTEEVSRAMHPGLHGTTFGGGPLVCAVAVAVIDTIEKDGLLQHAATAGEYFLSRLRELATKHDCILDVRGKGLMIAAELNSAELAAQTVSEMMQRQIIINCTSDTVLRFLPPFIVNNSQIDTAIEALDAILTEYNSAHATAAGAGGTSIG